MRAYLTFIIGIGLLLIVRYICTLPTWQESQPLTIAMVVYQEPSKKIVDGQTYATVWMQYPGSKIGFRLPASQVAYTDRVIVQGQLQPLDQRTWWLDVDTFQVTRATGFMAIVRDLRSRALQVIDTVYPPELANVVAGMVLGSKSGLSPGLEDTMKQTGTIHVLVASGFNVMLVVSAIIWTGNYTGYRKLVGIIAILTTWLYSSLVGFEAPIVRAAVMATLSLLAIIVGRQRQIIYIFGWSLVLMLLYRPIWLFDVGWQLSVLATAGLIWITPLISPLITVMPFCGRQRQQYSTNDMFESLPQVAIATISAQLAVFGVVMHYFGYYSVVSIPANIAISWFVPIITMVGMGGVLTSWVSMPISSIIFATLMPILKLFTDTLELISNYSTSGIPMQKLSLIEVTMYYVVLIVSCIALYALISKNTVRDTKQ